MTNREKLDKHLNSLPLVDLPPKAPLLHKSDYPAVPDKWKQPAVPRHVVQMFVVDDFGKLLMMHRSNNVHSARNVWSIPTGTHEIGETAKHTIERELMEEYGLQAGESKLIGQYENIAGDLDHPNDPQYHWVLSLFAVRVDDVSKAINREPEKHDKMEFVDISILSDSTKFLATYKFHDSLQYHMHNWPGIYFQRIVSFLDA